MARVRAMPAPSPISTRPRHALAQLPAAPGVYRFRGRDGRVLYIGRATELRHRVASYWSDLGDRRRLAPMVRRIDRIEAIACDSVHEAAWLERNLLETTMPRWNRTAGGQEVPVYVRLDARPAAPGVSVVHADRLGGAVQVFGPYLGGLRVRQAVSGLHRILPLAYTARTLSGAEREMARLRGVAEVDRDRVVATIAGVLGREPADVALARTALEHARDRASDALAFELAGRVQAEIDALDWITSPQRVTTADAGDLDVYGWHDGLLVRFEVRAGRLCTWTQRPCGDAGAQAHLAATPDAWRGFAQRNAELAVALAHGFV